MESVVEAIKIQTDAIAALAAAVEKMSRTVSNFVFAQRGSRKWASNQGQGEVREEREKKQAEKKKNAAATSIAAAKSAGADAEDAEGANAEDMAEVTEERKKAQKKEKREEKERKQNQAEKKKGVKESEKNVNAENAEKPMSAEDIAMRESARTADVSAVGEVAVKKEVGTKWSRSLVDAGADAFWASWNQSCAVVEGAQPNAMELRAGERDWVCVGDFSGNSSRWQEDASETAAVIAESVVSCRLRGEGDDMLCGVMKDAEEEEVPVAEAVSYAAAVAAVAVMAAPMAAQMTAVMAAQVIAVMAVVAPVAVLAVTMMAVTAKVAEAEEAAAAAVKAAEAAEAKAAAAAVMAAEAVEAAVKVAEAVEAKAETAMEAEAATEAEAEVKTKQQKWEQECAKAVRCHEKEQEWEHQYAKWERRCRYRGEDGWWAALDERISTLETVCAKQAHGLLEMCKIVLKSQKETIKAQ